MKNRWSRTRPSLISFATTILMSACSSTPPAQTSGLTMKTYERCTASGCEDAVQVFNPDGTIASPEQTPDQIQVIVGLLVGEDGSIKDMKVVTSSGHPSVDALALKIASGWRLKPAIVDGKPASKWGNFGVTIKLTD